MTEEDVSAFDAFVVESDPALLIVTVAVGEDRAGCLVGFATQTSISPRRYLVCLSRANHTTAVAARATRLAVHLVPEDAVRVAEVFGGETGEAAGKFEQVDWRVGPDGLPLLRDCPTRMVGRIVDRLNLGDHVGHVLAPEFAEGPSPNRPLRHRDAAHIDPGQPA
ncbi:MAG: flavin reductase family protein [Solirubrobacteraceae bacterium]